MCRWLIVVALTACHDKDAAPTAGSATPAGPAAKAVRPANAPALPKVEVGPHPSGMAPAQAFAAEQPDPEWAPKTEKTLQLRLAQVPGAKVICKQTVCEVAVAGDQMKAINHIQGLSDLAQNVTLTQDNGELRAYLRFERPDQN